MIYTIGWLLIVIFGAFMTGLGIGARVGSKR